MFILMINVAFIEIKLPRASDFIVFFNSLNGLFSGYGNVCRPIQGNVNKLFLSFIMGGLLIPFHKRSLISPRCHCHFHRSPSSNGPLKSH